MTQDIFQVLKKQSLREVSDVLNVVPFVSNFGKSYAFSFCLLMLVLVLSFGSKNNLVNLGTKDTQLY